MRLATIVVLSGSMGEVVSGANGVAAEVITLGVEVPTWRRGGATGSGARTCETGRGVEVMLVSAFGGDGASTGAYVPDVSCCDNAVVVSAAGRIRERQRAR